MLKAILIFVGLLSFSVGAEPWDMSGHWAPNGEVAPSFRTETVIQRDWNATDKARLAELRSQGYACVFVHSNTYKCRKSFFDLWEPSESHRRSLAGQFEGKDFEIVKTVGEPQIITEGDSVIQWQLPALVYNSFGKTDSVIYWELNGLNKLQFEINGESFWPHFTSADKMSFRTFVFETIGNVQTLYYYDVVFTRSPLAAQALKL